MADDTSKLRLLQIVTSALNASATGSIVIAGGFSFPIGVILPIVCTLPVSGLYFYAAYRAATQTPYDLKICLLQIGIALSYAAWGSGAILTSLGVSFAKVATTACCRIESVGRFNGSA